MHFKIYSTGFRRNFGEKPSSGLPVLDFIANTPVVLKKYVNGAYYSTITIPVNSGNYKIYLDLNYFGGGNVGSGNNIYFESADLVGVDYIKIYVTSSLLSGGEVLIGTHNVNPSSASSQDLSSVLDVGNSAGNKKITNLAPPVSNNDAVTKSYVDTQISTVGGATVIFATKQKYNGNLGGLEGANAKCDAELSGSVIATLGTRFYNISFIVLPVSGWIWNNRINCYRSLDNKAMIGSYSSLINSISYDSYQRCNTLNSILRIKY